MIRNTPFSQIGNLAGGRSQFVTIDGPVMLVGPTRRSRVYDIEAALLRLTYLLNVTGGFLTKNRVGMIHLSVLFC